MRSIALAALAAPFALATLLPGCSDRPPSSSSSTAISASDPTGNGKVWDVQQNWGEVADTDKDQAVNEAFAALASSMAAYNTDAANAMSSMVTKDFGAAVTSAQATLTDQETLIASHGLTLGDFVPTAIMINVGFSGSGNFYIGGASQGVICFILMPVKDTWMVAGDPTIYSQWSYHLNVTMIAGAVGWGVGAGAIWGTLPDITDLQGPMLGIWGTGNVGIGFDADLFILQHSNDPTNVSLSGGDTNIMAYGLWTAGAEETFAIHVAGGVAFNLPEVLSAIGIANNTLMGVIHAAGGSAPSSGAAQPPASGGAAQPPSSGGGPQAPVSGGGAAQAPAAPPASADAGPSTPSDDAAAVPSPDCSQVADGSYCGGDGVSGDPSTLYQCAGGSLSSSSVCTAGCQAAGAGADSCN